MHYILVFSASHDPYRNIFSYLFPLLFTIMGIGFVFFPKTLNVKTDNIKTLRIIGSIYIIFSPIYVLFDLNTQLRRDIQAGHDEIAGNCRIIGGVVSHFVAMDPEGHNPRNESFDINGIRFEYSNAPRAGFNDTAPNGGPLRDGLPVRLCYRGGDILRLEVAE